MIRAMFKGPLGVMISHFTLKYEAKLFGDLAYMTGLDSVNDKRKILHVYSTDDPTVLYKYNYLPLEKADNNPAHKRVVFKDKEHFPLMTRSAVIKFRKKQAEVNRLLGEGKSVQEIKDILNEDFNWDEIVEQDKTVWKIVTDFLNEA